jgi:hypothetical protein
MIDLDKLENLARSAVSGNVGDRVKFSIHVMDPEGVVAIIDEVRRLRAALSTPQSTRCELGSGGWSADGAHHAAAETAFMSNPRAIVTVYYGEKRTYETMAAFCAAHPRAPA